MATFNVSTCYAVLLGLIIALDIIHVTHSFQLLQSSRQFLQISKAFKIRMAVQYPTRIKNVISKMTESTQSALQERTSRMEIELPPGADFGVEASAKGSKQRGGESNTDRLKRSNREAARLVAEMFSSISSTTVALFPSEAEASDARMKWGPTFRGQVFSIDSPGIKGSGKLHSRRMSSQEKEQALLGSDGIYIPDGTDVIIVAGPRGKDVRKLLKVHEKVGDKTLIIIINGRAAITAAKPDDVQWIEEEFVSVFNYAPPALSGVNRELLLYHEFGGSWYLAEKGKDGSGILGLGGADFKTIWEGEERPSVSQLQEVVGKASV